MAVSSVQWSVIVVFAAVGFVYVNNPDGFHNTLAGLLGKVRAADDQPPAVAAAAGVTMCCALPPQPVRQ
jgi:hypothetical protein